MTLGSFVKRVVKRGARGLGVYEKIIAVRHRDLTKFLNITGGVVYNTHEIDFSNGKIVATGNDPQILVKFDRGVNAVKIEYKIKHNNDPIEIFSAEKREHFTLENMTVAGRCDGKERIKTVPFERECRYMRIDLGQSKGEIQISKIKITPSDFRGNRHDLTMKDTPMVRDGNGCVIVTHSMNETGAPLLAFNISKTLKERGMEVAIVALSDGFLEEKYEAEGMPVFNLCQGAVMDRILKKKDFEKIVKELKQKGYEKVIINTTVSGIVAPYFSEYGYKIVTLVHEMKNSIVNYDMKDGGRNANFYADVLVFPDEIVKREWGEIFESSGARKVVMPQGLYKKSEGKTPDKLAMCRKYKIPKDARIIAGSGLADLRKGIDLFVDAAVELIKMEKDEECHFIWTGDYANEDLANWLNYQFEKIGVRQRMHNVGFVEDAREYQNIMKCADAFWLTSREDPFPSVAIEALEYGTPVVAFSGCGGANTLLGKDRGILVEAFDTKKIAEETVGIFKNPEASRKMLKEARKYISEKLDFDKYVEGLMRLFEWEEADEFADLTVVIPNYNYEDYLPMRIESIVNQTVKPREIIFLDDNSTDGSLGVVEKLLRKAKEKYGIKYKVIKNENNQGCFRQWVRGLREASYDYVWIAEADDYIRPRFVEKVMPSFQKEEVVLAYCKSCVIDENSVVANYDYNSYSRDLDAKKWERDFMMDGKKFVMDYLAFKNIIPNASSVILRKNATRGIEKFLNEYKAIGDWFAYIYIISKGEVAYFAEVTNGHRRHAGSIIAKQEKSVVFLREMVQIKKYLIENYDFSEKELNKIMTKFVNENLESEMLKNDVALEEDWMRLAETYQDKKRRENLLVIVPDFEVGGGQVVGIRLANNFGKYYNVFLLNAREWLKTGHIVDTIDDEVNVLESGGDIGKVKLFGEIFGFRAALSLIWWSDKMSYLAFGKTNMKRIISMHGCYENLLAHPEIDAPFFEDNVEKMLTSASHVVYTAEKNKKIFREKKIELGEKLVKIDNGFLLGNYPRKAREEIGIKKDEFVFGLVARGIPEKGYEQAIKGLEYVNDKNNGKCHLVLVGSGEYIEELKNKYKSEKIHFIDEVTEPLEWIGWEEIFDVGILPTYFKSESMPTVIIEMLFLGKPIIATDIGEIKTVVNDGVDEAGILVPLKDGKPDQEKVDMAMLEMVQNPERVQEYSKGAKKIAKRFDMDKCIEEYRKLIED